MSSPKDSQDSKNPFRVVITRTERPQTKIFSIRRVITYNTEDYLTRGHLVPDPEGHMTEGLDLAELLFAINGVQGVQISQYDVYVRIGRAFDWREDYLEVKVMSAIQGYLRTLDMLDTVSEKRPRRKKK